MIVIIIIVILKKLAVTVYMSCRRLIVTLFQNLTVYEIIIIDLTETSSGYTYHGDEKSGSGVLVRLHFIGLD